MKSSLLRRLPLVLALLAVTLAATAVVHAQRFRGGRPIPAPTDATVVKGGKAPSAGLHIEGGTRISNQYQRFEDGGKFFWDFQSGGYVNSGTNNCFSGAFYLNINNNGYGSNEAWRNKAGDEIEYILNTPQLANGANVKVSRRVKIYKDMPLARFLDIYENTSANDATLALRVDVNTNWSFARTVTSNGDAAFGDKDTGFVIELQTGGNPGTPNIANIVCDKRTKVRPTVTIQGNHYALQWNITVPARSTVILAYFASQNTSNDDLQKLMKNFQIQKLVRDLPSAVRRLIVNFRTSSGFEDIDLERSEITDNVMLINGDPINGAIVNKTFKLQAAFGEVSLPADQIIGVAVSPKDEELVRYLMKDGQIISGKAGDEKVRVQLACGSTLDIPFDRLTQWSYKVSDAKPFDIPTIGAYVMLRTGDRLSFETKDLALAFRTRFGDVALAPKDLARIAMDNTGNGVHKVTFSNGSTMAGFLQPAKLNLTLKTGQKVPIPRDMISEIQFGADAPVVAALAQITLSNGDELMGRLADGELLVKTDYGPIRVPPRNLKSLTFSQNNPGRAVLELWDGTRGLQGDIDQQDLDFEITPGPTIRIPASQIASLLSPFAVPPDVIMKDVNDQVAKLGSNSWKERQAATDKLVKMGPAIVPVLQERVNDRDAEIRMRVEDIIEKLGGASGRKSRPTGPSGEMTTLEIND